jgi:uncharacterized protein (TIGR03663 family)
MAAVLASAACFRLPGLDGRPMHADEANQAVKAGILWQTGEYRYDLADHHGPALYWLTLPSLKLSGAKDFAQTEARAYRIVPVVFGLGLVLLVLLVADGLGRTATLAAAALTAVSPAMVYFSRYYIQEMLLVFFTLGAIGSAWRYFRTRRIGWAIATGASLGLMHATKETWVLAAAAMAIATGLTILVARTRGGAAVDFRPWLLTVPLVLAVATFGVVAAALYSGFGQHGSGPWDSIRAYESYWHRGSGGGEGGIHAHPWYYYFELLFACHSARGLLWTEGLIGGLAVVGIGVAASLRRRQAGATGDCPDFRSTKMGLSPSAMRQLLFGQSHAAGPNVHFLRFLAFYTLVLTALYMVIPYKTPWCALSFLHGMILLAGAGVWALLQWPGRLAKIVVLALLAVATAHLGREAWLLSFRFAADPRNPYVYAHTPPDLVNLAAQLDRLARRTPQGHDLMIHVVAENYWPLPWYLRHFNPDHVGYWREAARWREDSAGLPPPAIVLLTSDLQPDVDAGLRTGYNKQMIRGLRPGVFLQVYVRDDLWPAMIGSVERGAGSVGRGAWGVNRGAWGGGRGAWTVDRGPWGVERGAWGGER